MSFLNLSFDTAEGAEILLRGEKWSHGLRVLGTGTVLKPTNSEGDRFRYRLPSVSAWSLTALVKVRPTH